jgi:hypothetical protein
MASADSRFDTLRSWRRFGRLVRRVGSAALTCASSAGFNLNPLKLTTLIFDRPEQRCLNLRLSLG